MVAGQGTHPLGGATVRAEATTYVDVEWAPVACDVHGELQQHETNKGEVSRTDGWQKNGRGDTHWGGGVGGGARP
jgi:hypothetical protein